MRPGEERAPKYGAFSFSLFKFADKWRMKYDTL